MRLHRLVAFLLPTTLGAQGVRSAAIHGTVAAEDRTPIEHAIVRLTNASNGQRWERSTRAGRYSFESVPVGGPYRLEAFAVTFSPAYIEGIVLSLGGRTKADLLLRPLTLRLPDMVTVATSPAGLALIRPGPLTVIPASTIASLPNVGRDFLRLVTATPLAASSPSSGGAPTGGVSIAGQNRALNSFLIDGGENLDQYTGRLPGRETLPRPISLEALQEIQVLAAPFDVRHGNFAGGLVNAVTRSGTNQVQGSIFAFVTASPLVGDNASGERVQPFATTQYGATIGGPLVRNRATYFLAIDVQDRVVPDPGPLISDTVGGADTARIRIAHASVLRLQDILRTTYRLDPGTVGPEEGVVSARDLFAKADVQLSTRHHIELSHRYATGVREGFIGRGTPGQYILSSFGRRDPSVSSASRATWTALLGQRWSNEVIASVLALRDECAPRAGYPLIRVGVRDVPSVSGELLAGTPNVCPAVFAQHAFDVSDNLTLDFGPHIVTAGTRLGAVHFSDDLLQGSAGMWQFENLDSLARGVAVRYDRALPGPRRGRGVRFGARQVAVYAQDRWSATARLTFTVGIRVDASFLSGGVSRNDALYTALGADTRLLPGGLATWSPRTSFVLDPGGDERTLVRGGIGLFSGPPPYAWVASAYRDDGMHELSLTCAGSDVPRFDPTNQPSTCVSGAAGRPRLTFFDRGLRMPQNVKSAIGFDRRLSPQVTASLDLQHTLSIHDYYVSDANLPSAIGRAKGEGGRAMYGTLSATGRATPSRRDPSLGQVVRFSNHRGDHATSATIRLGGQFEWLELDGWYAFTRARDRMSLVNYPARANLENPPLEGTLERRSRGIAYFEIPHRVGMQAIARLGRGFRLSMTYHASSGLPFTYTVRGDVNADDIGAGLITNDVAYVPLDSADIGLEDPSTWSRLNGFIESEPCLRRQRGRLLPRNSCRNAMTHVVNGRMTKSFRASGSHELEVTADLHNVLNLLNDNWGVVRITTANPVQHLLQLRRWDAVRERGVYSLLPDPRRIQDAASRWQLELSARYRFAGSSAEGPGLGGDLKAGRRP